MPTRLRIGAWCLFLILTVSLTYGQTPEEQVRELINQVDANSLVRFVRVLSGADSVYLPHLYDNIEPFLITTRRATTVGNDLASYFLKVKLTQWGVPPGPQPQLESFPVAWVPADWIHLTGTNIYGTQLGPTPPWPWNVHSTSPKYIISAHYDSWSREGRAPGADDNASGIAVVMEAARILRSVDTKYTVVYALFDMEEGGLKGSNYYARRAIEENEEIRGVINLDMLGFDSNNDRDFWIAGDTANVDFTEAVLSLNERYDIGLGEGAIAWGQGASDHAPFWSAGYPAVAITEGWWSESDDVNPYYHSDADTIGHFNLDTYHKMAKLAVAAIAHFALGVDEVGVGTDHYGELPDAVTLSQNYPNPFNPATTISYSLLQAADVKLTVADVLGRQVRVFASGTQPAGTYEVKFDATGLPSGIYFYRLEAGDYVETRRMVIVK